jgi:hypothetical protein
MERPFPSRAQIARSTPDDDGSGGGSSISSRSIARALDPRLRRSGADVTVRIKALAQSRHFPWLASGLAVLLAVLAGGGWWIVWGLAGDHSAQVASQPSRSMATSVTSQQPMSPVNASPTEPTPPAPSPGTAEATLPNLHIETATEQDVLDHVDNEGQDITVFRFKANPRILVLDFKSLQDQGRMLNRTAALVEKTDLPRDRVLSDSELDAAVKASGDTVETYYYGHDYSAPSLVRFFSLADRESIRLTRQEQELRRLLREDGWFEPNADAGLITIPQIGADEHVTARARATILHHELSHGEYFTDPAYAAFVHRFWLQTLTEADRQRIRTHLHSLGYDQAQDDLMENEAQAYLMFTDDPEFFKPEMVGMTRGHLNELRMGFWRTMPQGWLRDSLGASLGVNKAAAQK